MTKEELATERNEVREILEGSSEELLQSNLDKLSRVFCIINGDEKRIKDLEKENTELKEILKTYNGCGDWDNDFHTCRVYLQHEELQECEEQLAKAKELLNEFMRISKASDEDFEHDYSELIAEAEQFLKEVEK